MNLFRRKETKKSDFEIEEDDEEQGASYKTAPPNDFPSCSQMCFITDSAFIRSLQLNLSRLIAYAESADVKLQREVRCNGMRSFICIDSSIATLNCVFRQVAEKLANEAVKPSRQVQIVEYGGLKLLVPLTKSTDQEVQRLAAHALANLSVNGRLPSKYLLSMTVAHHSE